METKHWDVIIVGGGMAGLLTAYFLWEQGKHVLVLEANRYQNWFWSFDLLEKQSIKCSCYLKGIFGFSTLPSNISIVCKFTGLKE